MISKTKVSLFAAMAAATLTMQAQTKMMRLHNADGTSAAMSVAELQRISFLAPGVADKGMTINFAAGNTATVLFSDEPSITFAGTCLRLSSAGWSEPVEVEFEDVADLTFGEIASVGAVESGGAIVCRIADGEARFSGIPDGVCADVFSVDGKAESVCPAVSGELIISRDMLTAGIHIVRIGTFTAKIKL